MSKGAFYELRWQIAQNVPLHLTSEYGFSKYSDDTMRTDATARHPPSGLIAGFSGHPCPEIAGYLVGILRKSHIPSQGTSRTFCAICQQYYI